MSAVLSECGTYRYYLARRIANNPRIVTFIMLNPSTADADVDDPTIRKCKGFAERLGFGILTVVNLFAFRATKPDCLYQSAVDVVGPLNMDYINRTTANAEMIICAWGTHGFLHGQNLKVRSLLEGRTLHALETTKYGHPKHPLYISYDKKPKVFRI